MATLKSAHDSDDSEEDALDYDDTGSSGGDSKGLFTKKMPSLTSEIGGRGYSNHGFVSHEHHHGSDEKKTSPNSKLLFDDESNEDSEEETDLRAHIQHHLSQDDKESTESESSEGELSSAPNNEETAGFLRQNLEAITECFNKYYRLTPDGSQVLFTGSQPFAYYTDASKFGENLLRIIRYNQQLKKISFQKAVFEKIKLAKETISIMNRMYADNCEILKQIHYTTSLSEKEKCSIFQFAEYVGNLRFIAESPLWLRERIQIENDLLESYYSSQQLLLISELFEALAKESVTGAQRVLETSLRIFSHANERHEIDRKTLSFIVRSIEEFNKIVESSRHNLRVESISLEQMLQIIAEERARFSSKLSIEFLCHRSEFNELVKNRILPRLREFHWKTQIDARSRPRSRREENNRNSKNGVKNYLENILCVSDGVVAPDLSNAEASPLLLFLKQEGTFADRFLTSVKEVTNMLGQSGSLRKRKTELDLNVKKSVTWGADEDVQRHTQFCQRYLQLLGQHLKTHVNRMFYRHAIEQDSAVGLGPLNLLPDAVSVSVRRMVQQLSLKDVLDSSTEENLLLSSHHVQIQAAAACLFERLSQGISIQLSEKYAPYPSGDLRCTKTAKMLNDAFTPLIYVLKELNLFSSGKSDQSLNSIVSSFKNFEFVNDILPLLQIGTAACIFCCKYIGSAVQRILSRWDFEAYVLVTFCDTELLFTAVQQVVDLSEDICYSKQKLPYYMSTRLTEAWKMCSECLRQLQELHVHSLKGFERVFRKMCTDYFTSTLPNDKRWKSSRGSELPSGANPYCEEATVELLSSLFESTQHVSSTDQLTMYTIALGEFFRRWLDAILKLRIKFSYLGALLLERDFEFVRNYIQSNVTNKETSRKLFEEDVFRDVKDVVELLKLQPGTSSSSGCVIFVGDSKVKPTRSNSEQSLVPPQDVISQCKLKNKDEWLALRVRAPPIAGSRSCLLPPMCPMCH